MITDTTSHLALPMPHPANDLADDVQRLRDALTALDTVIFSKPNASDITAAINAVIASAPGALDTLNELAAALGNDPNFAATIAASIAAAQAASMPVGRIASATVLGGLKIGAGLAVDAVTGVVTVPSAAAGTQTFTETSITPTSNGQTSFTISGGYVAGLIELYLNGVLLYGGGDDYTASNGTSILLNAGVNTTDTLLLRRWNQFSSTSYYTKAEVDAQQAQISGFAYFNAGIT